MDKLKLIIVSSLFILGAFLTAARAEIGGRYEGVEFLEADISSGVVGSSRKSRVLAIYASSNTSLTQTEWFVLLSSGDHERTLYSDYVEGASGQFKSPPIFFPVASTNTVSNSFGQNYYKVMDYGERGISISSAAYIYKSAPTSGNARRVWLQIQY